MGRERQVGRQVGGRTGTRTNGRGDNQAAKQRHVATTWWKDEWIGGVAQGRTEGWANGWENTRPIFIPPTESVGGIITDGCFCMLPNPRLRASCLQLKLYNVWRMSVRYISLARSSSCAGPLAGCTQCLRKRAPRSATLASFGNDCARHCN